MASAYQTHSKVPTAPQTDSDSDCINYEERVGLLLHEIKQIGENLGLGTLGDVYSSHPFQIYKTLTFLRALEVKRQYQIEKFIHKEAELIKQQHSRLREYERKCTQLQRQLRRLTKDKQVIQTALDKERIRQNRIVQTSFKKNNMTQRNSNKSLRKFNRKELLSISKEIASQSKQSCESLQYPIDSIYKSSEKLRSQSRLSVERQSCFQKDNEVILRRIYNQLKSIAQISKEGKSSSDGVTPSEFSMFQLWETIKLIGSRLVYQMKREARTEAWESLVDEQRKVIRQQKKIINTHHNWSDHPEDISQTTSRIRQMLLQSQ